MKKRIIPSVLLLCGNLIWSCSASAEVPAMADNDVPDYVSKEISPTLVNPNATAEASRVYDVLRSLYGRKTISGVVAHVNWNTKEAQNVHEWTGRWPAINVFDYMQVWASKDVNPKGWLDYRDITDAINWWREGGLVGCMWHWNVRANNGTDMTSSPGTKPNETSFSPLKAMQDGTPENRQLLRDLDQVAGYLSLLQKQGIPVLWRPLHEAAGNSTEYEGGKAWFWWGADGPEAYVRLWRLMYDRFVNYHKLNNLIWIWNSQMDDPDWYPGNEYVDIVGRDNYYALKYPLMKEYKQLSREYPTKIITLAECGNGDEVRMSPFAGIWDEGSRWSWFMTWYDYDYNEGNKEADDHQFASPTWWREAFQTGHVVDRDEMKKTLSKPLP